MGTLGKNFLHEFIVRYLAIPILIELLHQQVQLVIIQINSLGLHENPYLIFSDNSIMILITELECFIHVEMWFIIHQLPYLLLSDFHLHVSLQQVLKHISGAVTEADVSRLILDVYFIGSSLIECLCIECVNRAHSITEF